VAGGEWGWGGVGVGGGEVGVRSEAAGGGPRGAEQDDVGGGAASRGMRRAEARRLVDGAVAGGT